VIEVAPGGSVLETAPKQAKPAESRADFAADYHLSFESSRACSRTDARRINLMEALRRHGPCSVYALAKEVERNYSNVTPTSASSKRTHLRNVHRKAWCSCRSSPGDSSALSKSCSRGLFLPK
jgi:predicted transcriptional regulator